MEKGEALPVSITEELFQDGVDELVLLAADEIALVSGGIHNCGLVQIQK
jgi:hypothetical protein